MFLIVGNVQKEKEDKEEDNLLKTILHLKIVVVALVARVAELVALVEQVQQVLLQQ